METELLPETKLLIKKIAISVLLALLLVILTWLTLSYVQKKSRDIQRLSALKELRADLKMYYFRHNVFPHKILNINKVKDERTECDGNLCLKFVPKDPLTNREFKYIACADKNSEDCGDNVKYPLSYKVEYYLESNNRQVPRGKHIMNAQQIY